jgi:hypothetical protein
MLAVVLPEKLDHNQWATARCIRSHRWLPGHRKPGAHYFTGDSSQVSLRKE